MKHVKLFESWLNEDSSNEWIVACYGEVEDSFLDLPYGKDYNDTGDIGIFHVTANSEATAIEAAKEIAEQYVPEGDSGEDSDITDYIAAPKSSFGEYVGVVEDEDGLRFIDNVESMEPFDDATLSDLVRYRIIDTKSAIKE